MENSAARDSHRNTAFDDGDDGNDKCQLKFTEFFVGYVIAECSMQKFLTIELPKTLPNLQRK